MPPEMEAKDKGKKEISMRHSKLKASEAAILMGELKKPSWESKNEGIHERVSFEDSIWGFDLAGGSFYKTPLRVTAVKKDSRADKAGIRPGDRLLRINDIDTSTLTIQEAHEIIIESGVHLRIAVTAPEDLEDSYHCWQDPLEEDAYDSEEERRKEAEKIKKRSVHAKVSSYWSLQWPWVSKRRVIYRESNCFMVPSKFESQHRDKFPEETTFGPKVLDDIVLHSKNNDQVKNHIEEDKNKQVNGTLQTNGTHETKSENTVQEEVVNEENINGMDTTNITTNGVDDRMEKITDVVKDNSESSMQEDTADTEESDMQENSLDNIENNIQENGVETEEEEVSAMEDDEVLEEVLDTSNASNEDEEKIFNDILNDREANTDAETIDKNER